jgi:shikimate kinase / 3-dehydroquinate synthase
MSDNIYLIGFMGSGKTTVGRLVATALNRQFADMDQELEKRFRMPIREVFSLHGEELFRNAESELLAKLAARNRLVVATGGGLPQREPNRRLMADSGRMVHLAADLSTCMARVDSAEQSVRPLWRDPESIERLFNARKPLYAQADVSVGVNGRTAPEVAHASIAALFPDQRFQVSMDTTACGVVCTWAAPVLLREFLGGRRVAVLTDRNVERIHLDRFRTVVENPLVMTIPPGDRSKTLQSARRLYEALLESRFDRGDLLLAVGGGVVTDLGAFVASTYKRGMGLVLVSTSLLGCVDAAVGGKAAVNLGQAKNVVGTFTVPELVIMDLAALGTLTRKHISEGLVEAYKTGLVALPELSLLIEREAPVMLSRDQPLLARVVALSAQAKADVVSRDFRESGLRRILNFGHTFGHAVEGYHRFRISHGQSVAVGMIVATLLSLTRGLISPDSAEAIIRTVRRIASCNVALPSVDAAWDIMLHDKKIRRGKMVFVLLEGVGRPVCVEDVTKEELGQAVARFVESGS